MLGRRFSHFEIAAKLGEGGMVGVWLARDTRLGRPMALKILPTDHAGRDDRRRRFEDEARAASALNHPGIAHVCDGGEADGLHFIAMEYVEGESLDLKPNWTWGYIKLAKAYADAVYLPAMPALFLGSVRSEPRCLALVEAMDYGPHVNPGGQPR